MQIFLLGKDYQGSQRKHENLSQEISPLKALNLVHRIAL